MLPLRRALEKQAPVEVVRALLDAYPEAAKEKDRVGRSASVWSCVMLCVVSHVFVCFFARMRADVYVCMRFVVSACERVCGRV